MPVFHSPHRSSSTATTRPPRASTAGQVSTHPLRPGSPQSAPRELLPPSDKNARPAGHPPHPSSNYGPRPPPATPQHFGHGAPTNYAFQYSQCNGRRKALLVGINYFGQRGQLRGCINDVRNMSAYLVEHFGYKREDMVLLTDDQQNPMSQPTKQNILRAMHWLVKDARPNDSLFFHYSGVFARPNLSSGRLFADMGAQVTVDRPRIWTATRRTATTR